MKLTGKITQIDKGRDRKTAMIELEPCERVMIDYSATNEEDRVNTCKLFEELITDSFVNLTEVTVHIDEEWNVILVEKTL